MNFSSTPTDVSADNSRRVLSVTQLNNIAKQLLEDHLPLMWVEGEISNLARPSSGHWYFTLKDERAQIRCAMFKGRNSQVGFNPKQGDKVLVRGRVSLYEGRGDFQLIAEHMEEAGFGQLQRQFEQLKQKLAEEGLFAPERKQPLPQHPLHIGVITSPSGAAIRDIISVLQRRMPSVPITVIPTPVQGRDASPKIITALEMAEASGLFDVLVLARGGGSLEDLWCFNDEQLARAIAECPIPIVSAVGHEIDFTIADFVADYRAPTPSAAAEVLSQSQELIAKTLEGHRHRLLTAMVAIVHTKRSALAQQRALLKHPGERLQIQAQRLDHLEMRLRSTLLTTLRQHQVRMAGLHIRLGNLHPERAIKRDRLSTLTLLQRLNRAIATQLKSQQQLQSHAAKRLNTVSPLNTLNRGYAIALNSAGTAITSTEQSAVGESITLKLAQGELGCTVDKIKP